MFDPEDQDPYDYETSDLDLDRNFDPEPSEPPDPAACDLGPSDDSNLPADAATAPSLPAKVLAAAPSLIDIQDPDPPTRAQNPLLARLIADTPIPSHATVPGLLARRSINLLIGSSTAGKTALALTQLELYLAAPEHSFLGFPLPTGCPPEQLGAIIASGTLDAAWRKIRTMDLPLLADPTRFPMHEWKDLPATETTIHGALCSIWDALSIAARQPVRFLLIDGMQNMLKGHGKQNDVNAVREFYAQIMQFCHDKDCTILGTAGQPKMRNGDSFALLADRVHGSTAWAQEADTLIGIEYARPDLPEQLRPSRRRIVIQPKERGHSRVLWTDFDELGWLRVLDPSSEDTESPMFVKLDAKLEADPPGTTYTKDELLEWCEKQEISLRTLERWITSRSHESMGLLEKLGTGTRNRSYKKPAVQ